MTTNKSILRAQHDTATQIGKNLNTLPKTHIQNKNVYPLYTERKKGRSKRDALEPIRMTGITKTFFI